MKAILLSAGYGSRLRPLTDVLPKCLLPINGHPLLEYWFQLLLNAGVSPLLVNLHYLSNIMKEWILFTNYKDNIKLVYEEQLFGTGGTLLKNRDFVGNEPVMLIHADNLSYFDPVDFINAHKNRPKKTKITMMTFKTPSPETCGIITIDNDGIIKEFYEKVSNPPGDLANAAVYIVEPEVIEHLESMSKETIDFSTEVLPHFIGKKEVSTYHNCFYHRDIGVIDSYLESQIDFTFKVIGPQIDLSWPSICKKEENSLDKRFVLSLSQALGTHIIDIERLISYGKKALSQDKKYIIYCKDADGFLDTIIDLSIDKDLKNSVSLIFFLNVKNDFSSAWLYENTGYRSIILYRN